MQAGLYSTVISLAMLLAAIPSIAVLAAGQWYVARTDSQGQKSTWILFWMAAAILLTIPFVVFSQNFFTGAPGLVMLLVIPALVGLQALLLVHWRDVYALWIERRFLVSITLLTLVLTLASTALGDPRLTALLVVPALAASAVWMVSTRLGSGGLAIIAVLLALVLIVDALGILGNHYVYSVPWLRSAYAIVSGLGSLLAVIFSALCLQRYFRETPEGKRSNSALYLWLAVILVLCSAAVILRHGVLVNATSRAAEDHLPFAGIAAGLIAGLLLALNASGKDRNAGIAFMILVPLLLTVSYAIGLRVDGQAITAARADRIGSAIERFYSDTGEYPVELGELTPSYMPYISGPLTGRGQTWCYQSGSGFYRLGYVFFQRYYEYPDGTPYWDPFYEVKVPYSAGTPPAGDWMCDEELRLYKRHGGL